MKKIVAMLLVLCLVSLIFVGCTRDNDRAEDNGRVTDDTTTKDLKDDVSDVAEDVTDALDGDRNTDDKRTDDKKTDDTTSKRKIGGLMTDDRVG